MAPEQLDRPTEVDHRADIYALGVVFYQMLTGELPGKRIEAPSKKVQIDVRLDEIVLRALEKKPELRFQQASVFKTQVEDVATSAFESDRKPAVTPQGTEILGKPYSSWAERHRGMPKLLWLPISLLTMSVLSKFVLLFKNGPAAFPDIPFQLFLILGLWFRFRLAYVATIVSGLFIVPAFSRIEPKFAALGLVLTAGIIVPVLWSTRWFFSAEMPILRRRVWLSSAAILGTIALVAGLAIPPSAILNSSRSHDRTSRTLEIPGSTMEGHDSFSFGPVIEKVVTDAIDFDSGTLMDLPLPHPLGDRDGARYEWFNGKESFPWMRQMGVDAVNGNHALMSANLMLVKLDDKAWEMLRANEL
jgi:hypothetical protein